MNSNKTAWPFTISLAECVAIAIKRQRGFGSETIIRSHSQDFN